MHAPPSCVFRTMSALNSHGCNRRQSRQPPITPATTAPRSVAPRTATNASRRRSARTLNRQSDVIARRRRRRRQARPTARRAQLVEHFERRHGRAFDFVMRVRDDHYFVAPMCVGRRAGGRARRRRRAAQRRRGARAAAARVGGRRGVAGLQRLGRPQRSGARRRRARRPSQTDGDAMLSVCNSRNRSTSTQIGAFPRSACVCV